MPLHLLDNLINLSDQTTARLNLGLGTTDTPTFNGITLTSDLSVGGSATVTNSITANTINAIEYDVTGTDGVITSTKDIRGWAFGSKATPTLTADATPQGVYFKPDGSVMYVAGSTTRRVYAYNLSPAWDVSTASATPTLSTVQLDNGLEGLAFSPDGKYLFTVSSSTDNVKRYTMTSGNEWDISTVSATPDKTFYLGVGVPRGIYFKPDGTRMYVFDDNNNTTTEYIMTSGNEWDISTATVGSSLVTIDATFGLAFSDDGKQLFFNTLTRIYQYTLPTPWVLTGGILTGIITRATGDATVNGGPADPETEVRDIYYNSTLNKFFFVGTLKDKVQEVIVVPQPAIIGTRPVIIANPTNPSNTVSSRVSINSLAITDTTTTNSNSTGALVVAGGVSCVGNMVCGGGFATTSAQIGTNIFWSSSTSITAPANGTLRLTTNNTADFNMLQLGPQNTSYPAIKRNGTGVDIVRADQTTAGTTAVWTNLKAQDITANGKITAANPIVFPSYPASMPPDASAYEGGMIFVSDEIGGATMAFSDGVNWRRVQDREVISDV